MGVIYNIDLNQELFHGISSGSRKRKWDKAW